ncbi:MAG TPA: hypothetical protein VKE70_00275 [Candidatus Solibacter sp.]|nr:hypothetical protein [Candidatus Solibacter sp.]
MWLRLVPVLGLAAIVLHGQNIQAIAVGHEARQDDLPAITMCQDGSAWIAWLSFVGDRDDVVIRQYKQNRWGTLQWVPGTSGDSWLPQIGCDAQNRVHVAWSQQSAGNWDLYARSFDPAKQEWGSLERLTSDPQPDVNPRLASDGKGRLAVVWQGFRAGHSSIFARILERDRWSDEIRVTRTAANDWEPAAAFDSAGNLWVAFDSYRNGNYDVLLAKLSGGRLDGDEIPVAASPLFEARATIAVDGSDRIWVAWEEGRENRGKDQGYTIRDIQLGVPLGAVRRPRIRCRVNGAWKNTATDLTSSFPQGNTYQPHVFADAKGSVWVAAKTRFNVPIGGNAAGNRGYWEYYLTHLDDSGWSKAVALPNSKGRSSTRIAGASLGDGTLVLVWPTDNRPESFYHRPLRQQVFAGTVPPPAASSNLRLIDSPQVSSAAAKPAHPHEAEDLKTVRSYRAVVDGKNMQIVRGDFHRHTELSWDGGGTQDGNLQDFYRYMIDVASMDFGASTDHQGGAWPYWWWYTQKMTDMYHVPGAYTPIFGYERSAIYPNGHRNIFFAQRSDSRVTPFHLKAGANGFVLPQAPIGDEPGVGTAELVENDTKLLYEDIRPRKGIAIPHTSATRMGTDWRDNSPDLEPVVEIFQGARTNYEQLGAPLVADTVKDAQHIQNAGYQPSGMVANAWAKGYRLGIIISSDHGSTHISYAMVYTADTSRQGILDAIRKRHTYGAMDNIVMEVRMGRHFMGDEFSLKRAEPIKVRIIGTDNLAEIVIVKDGKAIYSAQPNKREAQFQYIDNGEVTGRHYYYVRVQQANRLLAWSSPFFVN